MIIVLTHMIANISLSCYTQLTSALKLPDIQCPCCENCGMHIFAYYQRYVKNSDSPEKTKLRILRVRCDNDNCRVTHAVLPSTIVPYSQITMSDTISIIEAQSKDDTRKILYANLLISIEDIRKIKLKFKNFWKSRIQNIKASMGSDSFFIECISVYKMHFMQLPPTICGSYSCHHIIQGALPLF